MCGIAGVCNFNSSEDMQKLLSGMIDQVHHRGPDSAGMYIEGPVGLGHARLSIIDLSSNGDQPIHNEDKTIWIIFNGEIFNYPELMADLKTRGHKFYTQTDTEIIIHLYEEKGTDLFEDLNGQFAFAIWDSKKERLLLGRDRVGIRPLFYYQNNHRFVFGSEIKSIFADPTVPRNIDLNTLSDVFTCWTPFATESSFENIKQLPPGHFAILDRNGFQVHQYWEIPFTHQGTDDIRSFEECVDQFNELILDSARIRLRADVPVGAYLSGGIDSTFTSALVKKNFNNLLQTFSVGFTDKKYDEARFQELAVQAIKTEHRKINCAEEDIGENFPKIIWHTETPLLRTAPAPLYQLSKLVRESNFKVVLTGEGADEMFAGYNIFKEDQVRRFWSRRPESKIRPSLLKRLYPYVFNQQNNKAKHYLEAFFKKNFEAVDSPVYSHMLRWQNTSMLRGFFNEELKRTTDNIENFTKRYTATLPSDYMSWHPLSRAQYTEINLFLSNYLLSSQGDRMAMANSVEGRYPFLDHRVIEFAVKIPPKYRLNGLTEKYILKKAARSHIPDELIDRDKQPYRAPISRCFFNEHSPGYVDDLLSDDAIKKSRYFNHHTTSRLIDKCRKKNGQMLSERENMALVGILSTQLLDYQFVKNFPSKPLQTQENVKIIRKPDNPH